VPASPGKCRFGEGKAFGSEKGRRKVEQGEKLSCRSYCVRAQFLILILTLGGRH
jgi:hypothetical protein